MKTSGASRKKPSHTNPGVAHRAVTQPLPRLAATCSPSARSAGCSAISSAASISATSSCGTDSGSEELPIALVPRDRDLLALPASQRGVAVARHLRQHPLVADGEMELYEIAEKLDEDDIAVGGVHLVPHRAVAELNSRGPDRDQGLVADRRRIVACQNARTDVAVLDDQTIALARRHPPTDDVVVAHEAGDELGLGPRCDRQRVVDLLDPGLVHDDDAVRHRQRFLLVVRDVDEHQPELALEVAKLDAHPQLQQPVEVSERLVEKQRLRLRHENARERDTLLLSPGECARLAVGELLEADHSERVERLLAALLLRHPVHLEAELDVVEDAAMREEREVLEDRAGRPLVRGKGDER